MIEIFQLFIQDFVQFANQNYVPIERYIGDQYNYNTM